MGGWVARQRRTEPDAITTRLPRGKEGKVGCPADQWAGRGTPLGSHTASGTGRVGSQ